MMRFADLFVLAAGALGEHRLRSGLTMLGLAIGVASVVLMTSFGEGTRQAILGEFTQFGTNLLQVTPGKTETLGLPGVTGGTTQKLSLADAAALGNLSGVESVLPVAVGQARVEYGSRGRNVMIVGGTSALPGVWKNDVAVGTFLPPGDNTDTSGVIVIGPKLKRELFGDENALGRWVRAGGWRLRVIGVMKPKGQFLGWDMDDIGFIPVATSMQLFNLDELKEINVIYSHDGGAASVVERIRKVLTDRHRGREDFTIMTQAELLEAFGKIMGVITSGVVGVAAISLLVGAIGILSMMSIAVGERTREIGLLRAMGASAAQIRTQFLLEATLLSTLGGALGLGAALLIVVAVGLALPQVPLAIVVPYASLALGTSTVVGLVSGVMPAQRAASLAPIDALRAE